MRKVTRKRKEEQGVEPKIHRKANNWQEHYGYHNFKLTESQKELVDKVNNHTLTFVDSVAGTGKSTAVLWHFAREYVRNSTKKIIVIRTPMEAGGMDKVGFLPNSLEEKVAIHFASSKNILEQMLTKGKVENDLGHRIHFKIPNFVLGETLDNSLIFIDEAQALQPMIMKLLLERTGIDSTVVVAGCSSQLYGSEANKRNGLKDALNRFFDKDMNPLYPDVSFHKFQIEDIQRSEIVKTVIKAYSDYLN
jgi:phosphate starvation-inducible protein PhoH and related proteins